MKRNMVLGDRWVCGCGPCVSTYHKEKKDRQRKKRARQRMKATLRLEFRGI